MEIKEFFIRGDIRGAISFMREHQEYSEILPLYVSLFEKEEYISYDIPDELNRILRLYQEYYRDIFYLGIKEGDAEEKLISSLQSLLNTETGVDEGLGDDLRRVFEEKGYHALFGKTQGYFGPYVWKETVPTLYCVELPSGNAEYKVNILKGFVFRSWMDYLTFGMFGTGGWASPDGTINCIEKAYDFSSERFLVSLLKHEAQHTLDMKEYPDMTNEELEYRAKLVELHYSSDLALVRKFFSEAESAREEDGHGLASLRIRRELEDTDISDIPSIQKKALELFLLSNDEMKRKYSKE